MIPRHHFQQQLYVVLIFVFGSSLLVKGQEISISSTTILSKSVAFHDPNNQWPSFKSTFYVVMETPSKPTRTSKIQIDLPQELFDIRFHQDDHELHYSMKGSHCTVTFDGNTTFTAEQSEKYLLNCDRAQLWRDYYTYLYGLPMKLYDPGTHLAPQAQKVQFKGKDYWQLKVTYDANVGSDVWFFYFNTETYAMEAYQFYKGDPQGEGKDTGEYILLSEIGTVNGILMPKIRRWFYNKDDAFLGTDFLYNSPPQK